MSSDYTNGHVSLDPDTLAAVKQYFADYRDQGVWTPEALAFLAPLREHPAHWPRIRELAAQVWILPNELEKTLDAWLDHASSSGNGVHPPAAGPLVKIDFATATAEERQAFFAALAALDATALLAPPTLAMLSAYMDDIRLWHTILDRTTPAIGSRELEEAARRWRQANPKSVWDDAVDATWFAEQPARYAPSLVRDMLYPGCLTMVSAPRGTGKSMATMAMAIAAATGGCYRHEALDAIRLLYVDRDNPPELLKQRLKGWGVMGQNMHLMTRDHAPSLVDKEAWAKFPADLYDAVIIDSFGASTIGVSEREGAKTQEVLETLKALAHRGPAVLVLANTTKSANSYRGRGEIADTVDLLYEARDITGWQPPVGEAWWEHLPDAGDDQWASRASRRRGQTALRLAFIPSKFRLGIEPEPFCLEMDTLHTPWTLADVTEQIEQAGAELAQQARLAEALRIERAINALIEELASRPADRPMLKREAEGHLQASGLKRSEARDLIEDKLNADVHPESGRWHLQPLENQRGNPSAVVLVAGSTPA
jgi:hypothetical protein